MRRKFNSDRLNYEYYFHWNIMDQWTQLKYLNNSGLYKDHFTWANSNVLTHWREREKN